MSQNLISYLIQSVTQKIWIISASWVLSGNYGATMIANNAKEGTTFLYSCGMVSQCGEYTLVYHEIAANIICSPNCGFCASDCLEVSYQ